MHAPVLLKEAIEHLNLKKGDIVLDGTVGNGGHTKKILEIVGKSGKVIGLDRDEKILERLKYEIRNTKYETNLILINENFRDLDKVLETLKIKYLNAALFDLGVNSDQLENSGRGFSFLKDEPLLMTMDGREDGLTAREILNKWPEKKIADILFLYGEERYSRRIAKKIAEFRQKEEIETTGQLVEIIRISVPHFYRNDRRINCATRTFQALRVAVNDELGALPEGLGKAWEVLKTGGRICVISFHSLEDRIVKNFFRSKKNIEEGKLITKKPIVPAKEEIEKNPRSRSAKMRIIEKVK